MSEIPEISVVMANYNGGRYLEAAIASLQCQTVQSWELIIVDDASTDGSVVLAEKMADGDPRIAVIRQAVNRGPAAARNRAIGLARGQWIAVFDNDDLMLPDRFAALRDRARRDNASIVADNLLVFSESVQSATAFLSQRLSAEPRWITLAEFIDSNRLYSRSPDLGFLKPFIRADFLRASGVSYDENLRIGEDYDFLARLLASGARLRLEPSTFYLYRKHDQSISHRIGAEHIVALMDADERLARFIRNPSTAETAALRKRKRTLDSMLAFDRLVSLVKAGQYGKAASIAIGRPHIWPLLTRPIKARLGRLHAARRHPIVRWRAYPLERR